MRRSLSGWPHTSPLTVSLSIYARQSRGRMPLPKRCWSCRVIPARMPKEWKCERVPCTNPCLSPEAKAANDRVRHRRNEEKYRRKHRKQCSLATQRWYGKIPRDELQEIWRERNKTERNKAVRNARRRQRYRTDSAYAKSERAKSVERYRRGNPDARVNALPAFIELWESAGRAINARLKNPDRQAGGSTASAEAIETSQQMDAVQG